MFSGGLRALHTVLLREVIAGTCLLAVTGFAATVIADAQAGRVLVIAITCAAASALCTDPLSRITITLLAVLAFVAFVGRQPGLPTPWPYTPVIVFAAIVGAGYRKLSRDEDTQPD
jgi:hypothetical protein